MRAPVAADGLVFLVRRIAPGVIALVSLSLPIAPDLHVFSTIAILLTGLVRLQRRLLGLDGSGLGSAAVPIPSPVNARNSAEADNNASDVELLLGVSPFSNYAPTLGRELCSENKPVFASPYGIRKFTST
jgi:hypothetical protein